MPLSSCLEAPNTLSPVIVSDGIQPKVVENMWEYTNLSKLVPDDNRTIMPAVLWLSTDKWW